MINDDPWAGNPPPEGSSVYYPPAPPLPPVNEDASRKQFQDDLDNNRIPADAKFKTPLENGGYSYTYEGPTPEEIRRAQIIEGGGIPDWQNAPPTPETQARLDAALQEALAASHNSQKVTPESAYITQPEVRYFNKGQEVDSAPKATKYLVRDPVTGQEKWMDRSEMGATPEEIQAYKDAQAKYETQKAALNKIDKYKTNGGYNLSGYIKDTGDTQTLLDAGFSQKQIDDGKMAIIKQAFAQQGLDYRPELSPADQLKTMGREAAENLVPGVYVGTHWNELSGAEKAFWIGIDALSVIPIVKGAAAGAREVSVAGREARLAGAAKGVGGELVAQARAPVDVLIDPKGAIVGSGKQVREVAENIFRPGKLPEAVVTTSNGTVRLRVTETTSPEQAAKIRDNLMELAAKGEKPIVEANGVKYELSQSPLMQANKGGLAHATPQGEAFASGIEVASKPGMPAREQGLFVSHEPLPRFAESSAHGASGEKAAIIITSPETAKKAISSEKLYPSPNPKEGLVAEMERKFPVGAKLPEPKQKLFTRVGPDGTKVELWLEKPLGKAQIAKLKAQGLIEDFKAPFKPAINISGDTASLTEKEAKTVTAVLDESGNHEISRTFRRAEASLSRSGTIPERGRSMVSRTSRQSLRATNPSRIIPPRLESARVRTNRSTTNRESISRIEAVRTGTARNDVTRSDIIRERTTPGRTEPVNTRIPQDIRENRNPERINIDRIPGEQTPPPREERVFHPENHPPVTKRVPPPIINESKLKGSKGKLNFDGGGKQPVHTAAEYTAAVTWKQGLGWWTVFPDKSKEFSMHKPDGAREISGPDKNRPQATIQVYQPKEGTKRVTEFTADMGIEDVRVRKSGNRILSIGFKQDRFQRTNNPVRLRNPNRLRSVKDGRIYRTKIGKGEVISREPI